MRMTYRINELFYSLQGEGRWAGRPALFLRFSGCNLRCPFCDTDFSSFKEMEADEIIERLKTLGGGCRFVVVTGGEPALQLDDALVDALHAEGYYIAMETNGTRPHPKGVDWVTLSPKDAYCNGATPVLKEADEVKLVFDAEHPVVSPSVHATYYYLQPCDVGDTERNQEILGKCVEYVKQHPEWQLSLQQHKILNIR